MMVWCGRVLAATWCPRPSSYPRPYRLYLIQPCLTSTPAVENRLICHVSNANFNVVPSHMPWKKESATVMLWLLSNPQLNKHRGHLQVGRHWDVCLSRQSTSLPLLQLTPFPLKCKGEETASAQNRTSRCDLHYYSCHGWPRKLGWHESAAFMVSKFKVVRGPMQKRRKKCQTLEDIISKGLNQIGWKRWLWMINHCNNKSDLQTETQIKIKSKYWDSG